MDKCKAQIEQDTAMRSSVFIEAAKDSFHSKLLKYFKIHKYTNTVGTILSSQLSTEPSAAESSDLLKTAKNNQWVLLTVGIILGLGTAAKYILNACFCDIVIFFKMHTFQP